MDIGSGALSEPKYEEKSESVMNVFPSKGCSLRAEYSEEVMALWTNRRQGKVRRD
jgi:hypothetical protein